VEEAIGGFDGVLAANVYGVRVPGRDGRAGMATVAAQQGFDLTAFREHLAQRLPDYARPVFVRLRADIETTTTFKIRKVDLVQQGFDPRTISDPIYVNDPAAKSFVRVDTALYDQIVDGKVRL
jgi:fatty-acyl-CoA synthase